MKPYFRVIDKFGTDWDFDKRCNHVEYVNPCFVEFQETAPGDSVTLAVFPVTNVKMIIRVEE